MKLLSLFKISLRSIRGNKLRSFLTMLGIIIGVASVIVLISIGQGSNKQVESQINQLGTNLITISVYGGDESLSMDDFEKLSGIDGVESASPTISGRLNVNKDNQSGQVTMIGTNEAYKDIRNLDVAQGRFITDLDVELYQKVVVLGSDTAANYFSGGNPVGETLRIEGVSYKVIGVLASKGTSMGQSGDDVIILPLTTAQRVSKNTSINTVLLQAESENLLNAVMMRAQVDMSTILPNGEDSYSVNNQQDLMETMSSVTETFTLLLAGIAGISLLVGGIGIMNIMLVSVSERTREIGIRKAIGAKRADIVWQFMIEAITLSALGGLMGVALGLAGAKLLSVTAGMTIAYSVPVIGMAFLFSLLVGIVFGILPAIKASMLRPIEALKFE
jgi:putative ABC transport system permease protein